MEPEEMTKTSIEEICDQVRTLAMQCAQARHVAYDAIVMLEMLVPAGVLTPMDQIAVTQLRKRLDALYPWAKR
jgi:hypothetical protein